MTITPTASLTPTPTPTATPTPEALEGEYASDEVIVWFLSDSDVSATDIARLYGAEVVTDCTLSHLGAWVLEVPPGKVSKIIASLLRSPNVAHAEPNYIARAYFVPDDTYWDHQSYLSNIQVPQAWDVVTGTSDIVIAMVDTGVDSAHPDLAAKIWHNSGEMGLDASGEDRRTNGLDDDGNGYVDDWMGWNTVASNGQVQDDNGHGTHVAGVAAADTNNGQGIAGVAWNAQIMVVKGLDHTGFGTYAQVAEGIVYAADHGARIINLSFGSPSPSILLEAAVNYASARGATIVAAAGNSGTSETNYPAAYPNVIGVGATSADNQLSAFSTTGESVDLVAPGVDVYATYLDGGYEAFVGTSSSAAQVSGVAALLASLPQFDTPARIRDALFSTALDLGDPGPDPDYGFGLVQAWDALNSVSGPVTPTPTPTLTVTVTPTSTVTATPTPTPSGGVHVMATPVAPTPAPTSVPGADDPHVNYDATTSSCAGCHRSHTSEGIVLRHTWPEEELCFSCHTAGGLGVDVQPAFAAVNTATRFFNHDVAATNGVHRVGQTSGADFGGANRHVECEDCHEPHEATRGVSVAPMLQREMNWVSGVDPMWAEDGPPDPALFAWLPQAEREYQVCFKCHSSFTTLPTYVPDGWDGTQYVADGLVKLTSANPYQVPDNRDIAQEFNPFNTSFHPVTAEGNNQAIPAGSFVAGWSQTSLVYCTDCHANPNSATEGEGPHGSPSLHLLDAVDDYQTADPGSPATYTGNEICFKCHAYATYATNNTDTNTNFRRGAGRNLHASHTDDGTCYMCHDSHGSEQEHLLNFAITPDITIASGYDSQTAWYTDAGGERRCAITCHGRNHIGSPGCSY